MSTCTAQDVRKNLSEIINKAVFAHEATVITRSGKNVVAVISYDDYERFCQLEDRLDGELVTGRLAEGNKRQSWNDVKANNGLQ